jgi:hypothetical protein
MKMNILFNNLQLLRNPFSWTRGGICFILIIIIMVSAALLFNIPAPGQSQAVSSFVLSSVFDTLFFKSLVLATALFALTPLA